MKKTRIIRSVHSFKFNFTFIGLGVLTDEIYVLDHLFATIRHITFLNMTITITDFWDKPESL